jgi:AbrB family looped-hinge helix DNA binding protein
METTKLSSKGQVIIPKTFRSAHHWIPGLELMVIEMEDGILLRPKAPFEKTRLDEVAGCLNYAGPPKSEGDIDAAMKRAARKTWHDRD